MSYALVLVRICLLCVKDRILSLFTSMGSRVVFRQERGLAAVQPDRTSVRRAQARCCLVRRLPHPAVTDTPSRPPHSQFHYPYPLFQFLSFNTACPPMYDSSGRSAPHGILSHKSRFLTVAHLCDGSFNSHTLTTIVGRTR